MDLNENNNKKNKKKQTNKKTKEMLVCGEREK